jgi:ferredoxin
VKETDITIDTPARSFSLKSRAGLGVIAITKKNNIPADYDCLKADCGICIMKVISGAENLSEPTKPEADFLKAMHADPEERLACQCRVFGPAHFKFEY